MTQAVRMLGKCSTNKQSFLLFSFLPPFFLLFLFSSLPTSGQAGLEFMQFRLVLNSWYSISLVAYMILSLTYMVFASYFLTGFYLG